jgi:type IV pilus assembly protein PilW
MKGLNQRGFSLVELMVAIAVALFLVAGVVTVLGNTRNTYKDQSKLSQLQDDQRLAMTLLGNVVQSAGYFPDPVNMTDTSEFKAGAVNFTGQTLAFAKDGQSLTGATNTTAAGDTLVVRFETSGTGSDNIIDCTGQQWKTAGVIVNTLTLDANNNLLCAVNGGTPTQLVSGVTNMQIWYGLKTDPTVPTNQVDTYVPTADMGADDWSNVMSLRLTLTFKNPLAGEPGQSNTIDFTRVIAVMNKAGVQT